MRAAVRVSDEQASSPMDVELYAATRDAVFEAKARALAHRDAIAYEDLPKTQELIALVRGRDVAKRRWSPPTGTPDAFDDWLFALQTARFAHGILDRLLHLVGKGFEEKHFVSVYVEAERGLLWDELPVDIVVPIALLTFEEDLRAVSERVTIERLSDDEQLARVPTKYYVAAVPRPLVGAATHAFVLAQWKIDNGNHWEWRFEEPRRYPLEEIETCFEALRLATGLRTGFAQIYIRPRGWAHDWLAHLPPVVSGPVLRRYPPSFDNFSWLSEATTVEGDAAATVGEVLGDLAVAPGSLRVASRRLSDALLREREADAVVDLCIALEAVLGDRSTSEITHKLALRTAAVVARAGASDDAGEVFRDVKQLYAYRSKVVHGGDAGPSRLARRSRGSGPPITQVAEGYVRRSRLGR